MASPGELRSGRIVPFDRHTERYEAWFGAHENAYERVKPGYGEGSFVAIRGARA